MNKPSFAIVALILLSGILCYCKSSGDTPLNFDREARELQTKINDKSYTFYHEKHPPKIEVPLTLDGDFQSEKDLKSGIYIYRLLIDDTGKFTYRALKPPPEFFEANIQAMFNRLKFKPAWIGPKNFAAELEIHFIITYEAH